MKILVAIESSKRAEEMAHTTLRWAARAGFNLRVFIPDNRQRKRYDAAIDDCNYHYYLDLPPSVTVAKNKEGTPMEYAKRHGFDLLLSIPDNLLDYHAVEDDDKSFIEYAEDVGKARVEFGKSSKHIKVISLDRNPLCVMRRVE